MKYGVSVVYSVGRPGDWKEATRIVHVEADTVAQARNRALEQVDRSIRVKNIWKEGNEK